MQNLLILDARLRGIARDYVELKTAGGGKIVDAAGKSGAAPGMVGKPIGELGNNLAPKAVAFSRFDARTGVKIEDKVERVDLADLDKVIAAMEADLESLKTLKADLTN